MRLWKQIEAKYYYVTEPNLSGWLSVSTSGLFLGPPVLLKAKLSLKYFYFTQKMKLCKAKMVMETRTAKKNRSNKIKNQELCTCSTLFCTFLCCRCCNVKLFSYTLTILWRKCRMFSPQNLLLVFLFTFFSLLFIFTLLTTSISHFLTATAKFSHCPSNEIRRFCFLSLTLVLSVALFLIELLYPVTYFLVFYVFLFLYIPNLWTWQLI